MYSRQKHYQSSDLGPLADALPFGLAGLPDTLPLGLTGLRRTVGALCTLGPISHRWSLHFVDDWIGRLADVPPAALGGGPLRHRRRPAGRAYAAVPVRMTIR